MPGRPASTTSTASPRSQAVGWEPIPSAGYRVVAPRVIVEVLRDGEPVASGETGEIVVTSIDNHVMPFLRYATGDLARLPDRPRPAEAGKHHTVAGAYRGSSGRLPSAHRRRTRLGLAGQHLELLGPSARRRGLPPVADRPGRRSRHRGVGRAGGDPTRCRSAVQADIEAFLREAVGEVAVTVRTVAAVELEPNGKFRAVRSAAPLVRQSTFAGRRPRRSAEFEQPQPSKSAPRRAQAGQHPGVAGQRARPRGSAGNVGHRRRRPDGS